MTAQRMSSSGTSFYDFDVCTLGGEPWSLDRLRGDVVLVVNTASACGFTPQLAGLEDLWRRYRAQGFQLLAFPCNQFGGQEPGTPAEIGAFCAGRYDVTFPLMQKVEVKGERAHPLFAWLSRQAPGLLGTRALKWNFTKFLVGRDGQVRARFAPFVAPGRLTAEIEAALAARGSR